eukprot:TRINITY_DN15015_c0_g1_i2.p1 TRINITY_DN15015_c0_g1~~TRINITY_DN15015_c0_g1_i2.p1  ORF type:complete len:169 (+),score=26.27 TRINITY_DN15015_c0_g1_i2:40-546(+)
MTYVPAYCSTFYAVAVTGYGSSYALGVGYERSPNSLKYQKPVFFSDNAFARWNDNYVPVLLVGSFVTSNTTDFVRSVAELSLLLFPAARELGTLFSVTAYMACGIAATLSWRLQSNINLEKKPDNLRQKHRDRRRNLRPRRRPSPSTERLTLEKHKNSRPPLRPSCHW